MERKITKNLISIVFLALFLGGVFGFFKSPVFASSTDGTIDPNNEGYKYAWGENIGWVNFGCDNCDVHVTDSGLSGYALSETVGWIYLGNITNNGEGTLSGYAWSENAGWIKFNPTNGGVVINSSGEFTGSALGENIGWIIFDCSTSACVKTDWRPQSARVCTSWTYSDWSSCSNSQQSRTVVSSSPSGCSGGSPVLTQSCSSPASSGGGGGLPSAAYNPPAPPTEGFSVLINNGVLETNSRNVILTLRGGPNTTKMAISNNPDFSTGTGQIPYQSSYSWDICQREQECLEGTYIVYVQFYTQYGVSSGIISDSIVLRKEKPIIEKIKEMPGKIVEEIKKIPEKITEVLKPPPKPEEKPMLPPIEEVVLKEAPLSMQGKWQLLPSKPIREFVLAPLPKEIEKLAEKFPELGETLKKVGITKITDIEKLKAFKLTLPGLTERVGLPRGVPVVELSPEIKEQLPSEIVFAKTGKELIDFNISLTITEKGEVRQKITTLSNKPLQLSVKPEKPVKSVKGYVVSRSKPQKTELELPQNSLLASLIFAFPVFAKEHNPTEIETRLVLLEFEYQDPDADGIYTAEIQAPVVEGEYEIITVMDYEDLALGPEGEPSVPYGVKMKEIRLIVVVDPEGYVFTQMANGIKGRIPGAIVSLYWLNRETKQYELWPAKEYQQENPQITDDTGKYSFLVPEGIYYLKVEAPGYLSYEGEPFEVKEGSGIHTNIELKSKQWWLRILSWEKILLIFLTIIVFVLASFLLYNFYRDKIDRIKK